MPAAGEGGGGAEEGAAPADLTESNVRSLKAGIRSGLQRKMYSFFFSVA